MAYDVTEEAEERLVDVGIVPCTISRWQPQWVVTTARGSEVGITKDDGCFVILCSQPNGQWRPTYHIPPEAAERIGELVKPMTQD